MAAVGTLAGLGKYREAIVGAAAVLIVNSVLERTHYLPSRGEGLLTASS
jgi:uncharacterized membrane protein YhiD involved in acid resistance